MIHIDLQGARVPALGLGTWQLRGAEGTEAVRHALEIGYRHIDTAQAYENEAEVGAGIAASGVPREAIFLATKVWMSRLAAAELRRSVEQSLAALGTGHVDLLMIHWPSVEVPLAESLGAMAELQAAGKVRHLGVSNFTVPLLEQAVQRHGARLLANQVEYHPLLSQAPVLDFLRDHEMMLIAYSPLVRGGAHAQEVLADIGRRHGKTGAQVALRWLVEQPNVAAIPKAASPEHRAANLDIFDFALDDNDRATIDALPKDQRQISPSWAPPWDPPAR